MNYLAHAMHCLGDPYRTAGVSLPDWLGALKPRGRCRTRHALPFLDAVEPELRSLAVGVVRHHEDDAWFHQTRAFAALSLELAKRVREVTCDSDGMRPSFVGHVMVELLLDAELSANNPGLVDRYYATLNQVDANVVQACATRMNPLIGGNLTDVIERFIDLQFLYDYSDDQRLHFRLNQLMGRVGLPQLPDDFNLLLPQARRDVRMHVGELLQQPSV